MPKIKSIKFIKDLPYCIFLENNIIWAEYAEKYPELFEIEYESEPKILKRPDGSIISGFESNNKDIQITCININGFKIDEYSLSDLQDCCEVAFKLGLIYLLEDKNLAGKKAKMLKKQLEITNEIERLNAEESWVADWSDSSQTKCNFRCSHYCKEINLDSCWQQQSGVLYSSKEILEKIQNKYSENELKQFLGIII